MALRVAINGFGRIGRMVFRAALKEKSIRVVAINDLTDAKTLAHLLKYDSVHGTLDAEVEAGEHELIVNGTTYRVLSLRTPEELPWKELDIDVVIESTGHFTARDKAEMHLKAGAGRVVISAPATDEDITIVMGINQHLYDASKHRIISNASCTTNCITTVVKVLNEAFGIEKGLVTTVHSYTNDQNLHDLPHRDLRRARAAALSIIPTSTGAARAVSLVMPELKGKVDGMAIRVPTPNVSIVDLVATLNRDVDADTVNGVFKEAADGWLKGILGYEIAPLVSVDYRGNTNSSTIDAISTKVIGDNMVKVLAWYDNECGFSNRLIDLLKLIAG